FKCACGSKSAGRPVAPTTHNAGEKSPRSTHTTINYVISARLALAPSDRTENQIYHVRGSGLNGRLMSWVSARDGEEFRLSV
ncbi:hypothetical protein BaRGS_00028838, partial [Batillaria attramentaria]